ncbi:hypothetical protein KAFR_0G00990 [Kazachstania africana CBS 2517]|uniref:Sulfhydryl oxidase n=1 Tax=Kazachstania africana (strain ATCC 22294 / BCRC 22015 / CBS 2517 / CECT 1963 / NBRC 1671 / NRRL Y-8276) TaxID=1071382 RepID=H2AXN2_KAZAF|nr:hypothetical protein KAFR_0G00990 [Kazachstania africana CBS 2517]CCF59132.1 hypothetical protein KAFR_0G00990 [Kazachstania africana CBS 2517]
MLMIRNRKRLYSLILALAGVGLLYFVVKDVKLALMSKTVIRSKSTDDSTVAQLGESLKEKVKETIEDKLKLDYSIMPSMPDQQAKKELGNASWKYFHTLLARFPDTPTQEERDKLERFVRLYAELYPCGECSYHFVKLIDKHPVQTSSRTTAAMWGCHIHNLVNEFLKKDIYDCATILEDYDCGCSGE